MARHSEKTVNRALQPSELTWDTMAPMSSASDQASFRPMRKALGSLGTFAVTFGTLGTLGVAGFLVYLWTGEGLESGRHALDTWRTIILRQWITQAVTLSSVVLRIINTSQTSVCTGLIAAMMLERHGVPLSRLAEFSLIRSNNDGPFRLSWMLIRHSKPVAIQILLILVLLLGSIATQFTSTILVSDLGFRSILDNPSVRPYGASASFHAVNQFHLVNQYLLKPSFEPFAEIPGLDPSPSQRGVSDTGVVRRIVPVLPQKNKTIVREYHGRGYILDTRFVCIPPRLDRVGLQGGIYNGPGYQQFPLVHLAGSISYEKSFASSGLQQPSNCPDGNCFPSNFNCTMGVRTQTSTRMAITGCVPSGVNAVAPNDYTYTLGNDPITNISEVFLFTRSNIVEDSNFTNPTPKLTESSTLDEWATFKFENGIALDVSMCFQQLAYARATVELSTAEDLKDSEVKWNSNTTLWDTNSVKRLFGLSKGGAHMNPSERGIYTLNNITNETTSGMTLYLNNVMIIDSYNSYGQANMSMLLSPYGGTSAEIIPHVDYQGLFADILEETNRPAVAFQSLVTSLSGSIISSLLSQFDIPENVTTVSAVSVLAPQRRLGLAFVLSILVINIICVVGTTSLYLTSTECTSQGNYWHAVSQIVSDVAEPILHQSTMATDDEVTEALKDSDVDVKIARSNKGGRIHVVRCEDGMV